MQALTACVQETQAAAAVESAELKPALEQLKHQMEELVAALVQSKRDLAASETDMASAQRTFELSLECVPASAY